MNKSSLFTDNYITNVKPATMVIHEKPTLSHSNISQNEQEQPFLYWRHFSFRKLWVFTGPGFLMSIAYLDPGNIESDLRSGSLAQYHLLWVLLLSTILGLIFQRLAIRLGVVTGQDLAECCGKFYKPIPKYLTWVCIEIAIIGSDMQEVVGTAIAFYLLSAGKIPLYVGVLLTIVDTLTFLCLDRYGLRKLELLFGTLIGVMAISFGYHYVIIKPNQAKLITGLFTPSCGDCSQRVILQAVGIVGAVVMPHNLYLHSALVKTPRGILTNGSSLGMKQANFYHLVEAAIALTCSLIINLFVTSVFAETLYGSTNSHVRAYCFNSTSVFPGARNLFPSDESPVKVDLFRGAVFLGCRFGPPSLYIWAVGLLAAGQSSTMTGTLSGQYVMQGFLNLRWSRAKRVALTRCIAILPTLILALNEDIDSLTGMNDALNALQSFQLPFALVPLLTFTSLPTIMGSTFVNSVVNKMFVGVVSCLVLAINFYFTSTIIRSLSDKSWWILAIVYILLILYVSFLTYLCYYSIFSLARISFDSNLINNIRSIKIKDTFKFMVCCALKPSEPLKNPIIDEDFLDKNYNENLGRRNDSSESSI